MSDHSLIKCTVQISRPPPPLLTRGVRSWRRVDRDALRQAIVDSSLGSVPPCTATVDELSDAYDNTLRAIADQFAPERTVQSRLRPLSPWFDSESGAIRCNCRRLERRFRRTGDQADKEAYVSACRDKQDVFKERKQRYWSERVEAEGSSPTKLWRSTLPERDKRVAEVIAPTKNNADDFLHFFDEKVKSVRAATDGAQASTSTTTADTTLNVLMPCTEPDVRQLIMMSPTKSCALDPIPTAVCHLGVVVGLCADDPDDF